MDKKNKLLITVLLIILLLATACAVPTVTLSGVLIGEEVEKTWLGTYTHLTLLLPDGTTYPFVVCQTYNLPLNQWYTFELGLSGNGVFTVKKIKSQYFNQSAGR